MGTTTFKTASDITEVERDNQKLQRQMAQLIEKFKTLKNESKQGQEQAHSMHGRMETGISNAIKQVATLTSSYLSVQSAVSLVNKELAEQERLRQNALNAQRGIAASQQEAIKNFAGLSREQKKAVLKASTELQSEVGFPDQAQIVASLGGAVSAGATPEQAISAVRAAGQLTRLTPQGLPTVAAGALDVTKATGISDAEKNIGFLLSAGAQARIVDPAKLAENLAPAVGGGLQTVQGQNRETAAREVAAIFAEITKSTTDTTGDRTRTAVTDLLQEMRDFFAAQGIDDPATVLGRFERISSDERLRTAFLGQATLGQSQLAVEGMLTPEGIKALKTTRDAITFDASRFQELRQDVSDLTQVLRNVSAEAQGKAAIERFRSESEGATTQVARDLTNLALEDTRGSLFTEEGFGRWLSEKTGRSLRLSEDPALGETEIDRNIKLLDVRRREVLDTMNAQGLREVRTVNELSPAERRNIELLEEMIRILKGLQSGQISASAAAQRGMQRE